MARARTNIMLLAENQSWSTRYFKQKQYQKEKVWLRFAWQKRKGFRSWITRRFGISLFLAVAGIIILNKNEKNTWTIWIMQINLFTCSEANSEGSSMTGVQTPDPTWSDSHNAISAGENPTYFSWRCNGHLKTQVNLPWIVTNQIQIHCWTNG